ncbi:MAG TPA: flippase-like domain-containing protein [Bacteroidota bacterium]|nr:flippase-like domain-containing protein [Bacteroidota bacterium]
MVLSRADRLGAGRQIAAPEENPRLLSHEGRSQSGTAAGNKAKTVILLIGIAAFCYLVWDFGIDNIVHNVVRVGWWFVPIVALWAVVYLFNALAWYIILRDHASSVRLGAIYRLTVSGFAINYVTPFINLGGEPYRVLSLRSQVGIHRAVSSVILYNMVRMLSHFYFWIACVVVALVVLPTSIGLVLTMVAVLAVVVSLIVFFYARHRMGIFRSLIGASTRSRLFRPLARKLEKNSAALLKIDAQITELYRERREAFYQALCCEFLARLIASFEFYFILQAIGSNLSLIHAFLINGGSSLILNLFFFVPFELGTREGGLYLVMQGIGVASGIGIFMGLINRVRELCWIVIGFALAFPDGRSQTPHSVLEMMEQDTPAPTVKADGTSSIALGLNLPKHSRTLDE